MVYKCPGKYKLHNIMCDYLVIETDELDSYIELGWSKTPAEADRKAKEVTKEYSSDGFLGEPIVRRGRKRIEK